MYKLFINHLLCTFDLKNKTYFIQRIYYEQNLAFYNYSDYLINPITFQIIIKKNNKTNKL